MTADHNDRINRLIAQLDRLTSEVRGLRKSLCAPADKPFSKMPRGRRFYETMTDEYWYDRNAKGCTDEPETKLAEFLRDFEDGLIADPMNGLWFAVGRDINDALTDIRATRSDIEAIQNDSDLRADFLAWQKSRGKG